MALIACVAWWLRTFDLPRRSMHVDEAELLLNGQSLGLCNRGGIVAEITAFWREAGITGLQIVRKLWWRRDLGEFVTQVKTKAPRHGAVLLRLKPVRIRHDRR